MDKLHQIKAKLEEMKAKYNFEREENEDNPNHSDGFGMFYSGFFTCLKEISHFLDTLETKDVDLEKEIKDYFNNQPIITKSKGIDYQLIPSGEEIAKHFYELGIRNAQQK